MYVPKSYERIVEYLGLDATAIEDESYAVFHYIKSKVADADEPKFEVEDGKLIVIGSLASVLKFCNIRETLEKTLNTFSIDNVRFTFESRKGNRYTYTIEKTDANATKLVSALRYSTKKYLVRLFC